MKEYIAKTEIYTNAPIDKVWEALISPVIIKEYMFGTNVTSAWQEGSSIIWKGQWKGNQYEEKGIITKLTSGKKLQYTRYNNLSGLPDEPESYNLVTIDLSIERSEVLIILTEDNNRSEQARERSESVWKTILNQLKKILESKKAD